MCPQGPITWAMVKRGANSKISDYAWSRWDTYAQDSYQRNRSQLEYIHEPTAEMRQAYADATGMAVEFQLEAEECLRKGRDFGDLIKRAGLIE